ncbi:tetratricopeptide repeat protein [uncultured bacterium]|nr:tetratricopeptide repeat protein [uncultured bacterium]
MDAALKKAITYNHQGIANARQGKNRAALSCFNAAIKAYPELPLSNSHDLKYRIYSNRGLTKEHLRDFKGALADYNKTLSLDPKYAVGYCNRGGVKYNMKKYQDAIADFKTAIKLNSGFEKAYFFLGAAYMRAKQNQDAVNAFTKLIKMNDHFFLPFFERGCAKLALNNYRSAISDFKQATHMAPPNSAANVAILNNMGMAENNLHHYSDAVKVLKKALMIIPGNHYALSNLKIAKRGLDKNK